MRSVMLHARQLSRRGGDLQVRLDNRGERVCIAGATTLYLRGEIVLPE